MGISRRQQPLPNGSGNTTLEVLIGLTVLGASVLSVLAVLRGPRRPPRDEASERDGVDEGRKG